MSDELELANKGGWWENRNKNATLVLVFVVMLAAKLLTMLLPAKYFYDNNRILGMTNEDMRVHAWAGSYIVAANFFKAINIFGFTTLSQWSWFLGLFLTLIVFFMVLRLPEPDMVQTIFLLACICNIFIYLAVNGYAKNPHQLGKYLAIFLGVSIFILCGTEHSIADMYYWAVSGTLTSLPGKSFLYLIVISLGNVVGGVLFPLAEKLYGKLTAE